ncbi:MAG: DUF4942 domain-containing protein [Sneathiellaceae bacterium]
MHPESDAGKSTALVPRATVQVILARRSQALTLYEDAHAALATAADALAAARSAAAAAAGGGTNSYSWQGREERKSFIASLDVPQRADFMATAQRITDIDIWAHLVELTDIERLMDKQAKDELRTQLQRDVPEPTADTVYATLERFALDAGTIFRRGIANAFSGLDRRFRSHDGWKIGGRVILTRMFDDNGWWNYHSNTRDTLVDIERAFCVLEGLEQPAHYAGITGAIENARRGSWGARQTEVASEYFTVRIFKNGNAHLWFRRDDLLRQVNKLLAEYYGEVIPQERDPRYRVRPGQDHTGQAVRLLSDQPGSRRPDRRHLPALPAARKAAPYRPGAQCRDRHPRPEMRPARRPRRLRRAAGPARRRPAGGGDLSPGLAGRLPRHAARFRRPL